MKKPAAFLFFRGASILKGIPNWSHLAEITVALMLATATVLTAFSAYQATRWSRFQAKLMNGASTHRIESMRDFNLASQTFAIDNIIFSQWVNAYAQGNTELETFYRDRIMLRSFVPIFDAWIASDPLNNPDALKNPLNDPAYRDRLLAAGTERSDIAEQKVQEALDASQTGDDYVLATVVLATVLFFAGIATKFRSIIVQRVLLAAAAISLLMALIYVVRLPMY